MEINEKSLFRHLQELCVKIGPRPIGSRANQEAASYIEQSATTYGLEVCRQEFTCPRWDEIETTVEVDDKHWEAAANQFSPPCDLVLPGIPIGTVAELEEVDLTDRIGILYGELTASHGIGSRRAFYYPDHTRKVVSLLEQKHPPGLLTVSPKPGILERLIRDPEFPIPSATVSMKAGLELLCHPDRLIRLRIMSRSAPDRFAQVIAKKSGRRRESIILLAHFDTMSDTPGAQDNGAGVAVLLLLAEILAGRDNDVGLEFIFTNAEETGGVGDAGFLNRTEAEWEEILAVINIDGVGQWLGPASVTLMGGSVNLERELRHTLSHAVNLIWTAPWYEGDHSAFLVHGVPCIPFSTAFGADIIHRQEDTPDWINSARLNQMVHLALETISLLEKKTAGWCRKSDKER